MGGKRRGAGEGSIYRRETLGTWGKYEVEGKRRYVYGRDRQGVRTGLKKALVVSGRGHRLRLAESRCWRVRALVARLDKGGPRSSHLVEARGANRLHIIPRLGTTKLDALQVKSLYRKKLGAGLSATAMRKISTPRPTNRSSRRRCAVGIRPAQRLRIRYATECGEGGDRGADRRTGLMGLVDVVRSDRPPTSSDGP